ncbi:MlaD family protein [Candidatus Kapabacteria bacterium]|nr:MlaD family protein [Candidatus Kapabacteria bacterium]
MSEIESRKSNHPFLIGIFVFSAIAISILAIFWLGANKFFEERNYYVTYFDSSIEGLEQGSAVKYQGVPVGTIYKVNVASDGQLIEIIMQIDKKISIDDSLRIKTVMAGIAGGKFLQLHFTDNPYMLKNHPKVDFELPEGVKSVIKSTPSDIEEITVATQKVINNLKQLEIAKISQGSLDFLKSSTQFLDTATSFLSNDEFREIILNIRESSENLNLMIEKSNNSDVVENLSITANNLMETSKSLELFSAKLHNQIDSMRLPYYLDKIYSDYDTLISKMEVSVSLITYRMDELIQESGATLEEFKRTSRRIRNAAEDISDQPSRIFSEPARDEK